MSYVIVRRHPNGMRMEPCEGCGNFWPYDPWESESDQFEPGYAAFLNNPEEGHMVCLCANCQETLPKHPEEEWPIIQKPCPFILSVNGVVRYTPPTN